MQVSIIVIGDELLIGQVQDTNSGWIARHLAPFGWSVKSVKVVGDNAHDIFSSIDEAFTESSVVLMTGGLGPTKDDITKPTLCKYFGGEMRLDEETRRNVDMIFEKRHIVMNELTAAQAIVPSSCRVIQNQVGTAPLMWFEKDGKVLVAMPGVPFETETMMQREVIPQLLSHFEGKNHIEHRTFVVIDHSESALAIKLSEFEDALPSHIHLAYLPQPGVIRLRLSGHSTDADSLNAEMQHLSNKLSCIIGESIISYHDKTLAEILGDMLRERNLTVSTAESCTGGNIAHQITKVAGCSDYFLGSVVSYSNSVKSNLLGVSSQDLQNHGAVSQPVVEQMACGVCEATATNCALATSGIAGPGGEVPGKPVGTVWIAAKCNDQLVSDRFHFPGNRERVIQRATTQALIMLIKLIR